ncbi:MAG: hypothetical protein ABW024_04325 [Microbacterium sp.]
MGIRATPQNSPSDAASGRFRAPRRAILWSSVALVAALAACAPAPDPGIPEGVEVSLIQLRSDVAARDAQVRIVNGTDDVVEIGDVAVIDERFADAAGRADEGRVTSVRPGSTVDIRVRLPAMDCTTDAGEPTVELELAASGATVGGPIVDALDVIAPLHERECRAERLAAAADVSFGDFLPSRHPAPAVLELAVAPTGEAEAALSGIRPTNLIEFDGWGADTLPLDLRIDGASEPEVVELPLVPLRCDPHAVQEDKRGTVFTLEVELEGEPGTVELAADEELRGRILTWVTEWCSPTVVTDRSPRASPGDIQSQRPVLPHR